MFTIKTKSKMLKAQFVVFMTRRRYVGSYPKVKRFILVNFLALVIGFVGWNISLQAPEISIKWDSTPITYENHAQAKFEANKTILEVETNPQKIILKKVGEETGVDWRVLWGIFIKETQGDCDRIGDWQMDKPSIGCFQISLHYHPEVKLSQATDLEWSAKWTADRMKKTLDATGSMDMAIMRHNGDPNNQTVQQYLKDVKANMVGL